MSISTRHGDSGETTLGNGSRCAKDDARIEACGALDELCAAIELVLAEIKTETVTRDFSHCEFFTQILRDLRFLMGFISGATFTSAENETVAKINAATKNLDAEIATLESQLPPINEFLSFVENVSAARFNLCRTICRRAERRVVTLYSSDSQIACAISYISISYLNRLSDFLFLIARNMRV